MKTRMTARAALGLALAMTGGAAWAAGGHHAVDDAAILEPGQCEAEGWFGRSRGGEKALHVGAGCRVGPVELGVAGDYARFEGESSTGWSAQAKWAHEIAPGFSAGLALAGGWQARARPRYQGVTLTALATWIPREDMALHLNLGRDFVHREADLNRSGLSFEWQPRAGWTLMAERYVEERTHFVRAGIRWAINEHWSVDASRAHRLRGPGESNWTVGLTRLLELR
jgi:hypothetical protein